MDTNQPSRACSTAFDWIPVLAKAELFADLSRPELEIFATEMQVVSVPQGQLLIRQDDPADTLYVILEGRFDVTRQNDRGETIHLNRLGPGTCFGELALITGERRTASVRASEKATVARLCKDSLERIRRVAPQATARLSQIIVTRLQKAELQNLLYFSDLFKDIGTAVLEDLESAMELMLCPSGAYLMREGEECDGCYLIVSGRLRVTHRRDGEVQILTELGRGQTVGEIGILTGSRRTATVRAIRDTMVAKLSGESFNRLLQKHPRELVKHFAGNVIKRLWMQTLGTARNQNNVVNIALIPTGNQIPLREFCGRLAECFSKHAPTLHLDSASLDKFLSPRGMAQKPAGDPENLNVVRWLNHQETKYRYLLYQTDSEPSEWTLRCLRQADRVVLVGDTLSSPAKGMIEETLLSDARFRQLPKSLVLLHRQNTGLYDRTQDWLNQRSVLYHYHVCPEDTKDMARLARLLSGKGVGLVLSGGGARGFAHIGAIRALLEAGIPIDKVGGSSMGSIVAAMTALRWDYETMMRQAGAFNYRMDYTFPAVALTSGRNITQQMKTHFGERKIEDLWISFFCVSTDLISSRQRVHHQGPLWKYVRASMSVPGLFPPVIEGSRFLVDGAVFNNIPVDVMRKQDDVGPLIAFDVGAPVDLETETQIDGNFSGWQALVRKFGPAAHRPALPSVTKTLIASWLIKSDEAQESMKNLADYYVRFPMQDFGLLDFDQVTRIAERGYRYANQKIDEWRRAGSTDLPLNGNRP